MEVAGEKDGAWFSNGKPESSKQDATARVHPGQAAGGDSNKTLEKYQPDNHVLAMKSSYAISNYSTEADAGDRQAEDDINNNNRVKEGTASATSVDS